MLYQRYGPSLWLAFANSQDPASTAFFFSFFRCTVINSATSRDVSKMRTQAGTQITRLPPGYLQQKFSTHCSNHCRLFVWTAGPSTQCPSYFLSLQTES